MFIIQTFLPYLGASAIFGWGLAILLTRLSIVLAQRNGVLAFPNQRTSHSTPTPRLGGIGIVGAFYGYMLLLDLEGISFPSPWKTSVLVGGAWAFVGGLLDDLLHLDPKWKFLFQFAAASTALVTGFSVLPQPLAGFMEPWGESISLMASNIFTVLFIVFFMNAFNFMDGMDGQAAVFGALAALSFVLPAATFALPETFMEIVVAGCLAGALLAFFQFYNRPTVAVHRKTFMGDCGSQFIGFMLALLALRREQTTYDVFNFWSSCIVLSPFIWDVCYTLLRRLLRGENILQAHRSHLYQRLLIAGWSHAEVLSLNFALWGACFVLAQIHGRLLREQASYWIVLVYLCTLILLLVYTLFVLNEERRMMRRHHSQDKPSHELPQRSAKE